jgi:hypothetical protein
VPSVDVFSAAGEGKIVFPLSELVKESPHFERIYEALSKVVRENRISELNPTSSTHSDFLFWLKALGYIGIQSV